MRVFPFMVLWVACMAVVMTMHAQPPTVQGFNAGSVTEDNVSVVIGQPFDAIVSGAGCEVSEGIVQAQLVMTELADETCVNEPYTKNGFDIPASDLTEGTGVYGQKYENNVPELDGYDRLTVLVLTVWPVYAVETSEMFHGTLPVIDGSELKGGVDQQIEEGENVLNYLTVHGCDSVVTLYAMLCPFTVEDGDHNPYTTVVLDKSCWTQQNLMAEHYADGITEIGGAMAYRTSLHPDVAANVATYGRFYTWASAVNAAADGSLAPDANGYVQGICPDGWHIPTEVEMTLLKGLPAETIRTAERWPQPNSNTNSTEFTALPAGMYKASIARFENLGSQTDWWSVVQKTIDGVETPNPASLQVIYYCDSPIDGHPDANDGLSVRCVMNN